MIKPLYLTALLFLSICFFSGVKVFAQDKPILVDRDGEILETIITDDGDTLIIMNLDDVYVKSKRTFGDYNDYKTYIKYRAYAKKVYPYARDAIKLYRQMEIETDGMKKRQRKKYIKKVYNSLENEMGDTMKGLSRTQGKILIKMIERELNVTFYNLLKDLRGGTRAYYYHQVGKVYDYDLKQGYIYGDDPILDWVLKDFNISARIDDDPK
jgi:hypothetical protein